MFVLVRGSRGHEEGRSDRVSGGRDMVRNKEDKESKPCWHVASLPAASAS